MPIPISVKTLSSFLNLIIGALVLVLAGAFFYLQRESAPQARPAAVTAAPDAKSEDKIVNKYLQQAARNADLQRAISDKNLLDARARLEEIEKRKKQEELKAIQEIPLERQIWKEPRDTAAQILDADINQSGMSGEMTEEQKKEYARQFIENARRGGYHIELSDDLEVIKAVPIRKPSQQSDEVDTGPTD